VAYTTDGPVDNEEISRLIAVKAVRLNGKDVTDRDVDFGHDVSGLEIEVVKRAVRQQP
jgi:hypothetical protein